MASRAASASTSISGTPPTRLGVTACASSRSSGRGSRLTGTPIDLKARTSSQQALVVGVLAGDDDAVGVVALDHLEGGDAAGGAGVASRRAARCRRRSRTRPAARRRAGARLVASSPTRTQRSGRVEALQVGGDQGAARRCRGRRSRPRGRAARGRRVGVISEAAQAKRAATTRRMTGQPAPSSLRGRACEGWSRRRRGSRRRRPGPAARPGRPGRRRHRRAAATRARATEEETKSMAGSSHQPAPRRASGIAPRVGRSWTTAS